MADLNLLWWEVALVARTALPGKGKGGESGLGVSGDMNGKSGESGFGVSGDMDSIGV
jgi:hypothetical protein